MDASSVRTRVDLASVPVVQRPRARRDAARPISRPAAAFAGLVGPVVAVLSVTLEPAPADPSASTSMLATVVTLALLGSWMMAGVQASLRRPQALTWALVVVGTSLFMTVGCPVSGHHTIGGWWLAQLAVSLTALVAAVAFRRRATR